jgi:hypothetical protein
MAKQLVAVQVLSEERRKTIFSELVVAQDHDMSVVQSRKFITKRFRICEEQVRQIEKEGMAQHWPPL